MTLDVEKYGNKETLLNRYIIAVPRIYVLRAHVILTSFRRYIVRSLSSSKAREIIRQRRSFRCQCCQLIISSHALDQRDKAQLLIMIKVASRQITNNVANKPIFSENDDINLTTNSPLKIGWHFSLPPPMWASTYRLRYALLIREKAMGAEIHVVDARNIREAYEQRKMILAAVCFRAVNL